MVLLPDIISRTTNILWGPILFRRLRHKLLCDAGVPGMGHFRNPETRDLRRASPPGSGCEETSVKSLLRYKCDILTGRASSGILSLFAFHYRHHCSVVIRLHLSAEVLPNALGKAEEPGLLGASSPCRFPCSLHILVMFMQAKKFRRRITSFVANRTGSTCTLHLN